MPTITSASTANPKPVTGFDYAGQPMKAGGFYNGRPEHCAPTDETAQNASQTSVKASPTRRKRRRGIMSPERRKAFGDRMRAYWAQRKAGKATAMDSKSTVAQPALPSVEADSS